MCRRFVKEIPKRKYRKYLKDFLDATDPDEESQYNVGPLSTHCILGTIRFRVEATYAVWGMTPIQKASVKRTFSNMSSETVAIHKLFKDAFRTRRCITWATGYYAWKKIGNKRQPYLVHFADHRPFFIYGIWQTAKTPDDDDTFAVLTTRAVDNLAAMNSRMPCIVDIESPDVQHWLDARAKDLDSLQKLLSPYSRKQLIATPVISFVNNVRRKGIRCIQTPKPMGWLF